MGFVYIPLPTNVNVKIKLIEKFKIKLIEFYQFFPKNAITLLHFWNLLLSIFYFQFLLICPLIDKIVLLFLLH
mgnify:CR=1 FL=1